MLGRPAGLDESRAWLTALAVGLDIFFTRLSFLIFLLLSRRRPDID